MNDHFDVVVVGGGIIGSCVALNLVSAGAGTVLLLDRDDLGEGTTAAGAGFLTTWGIRPADYGVVTQTWGEDGVRELKRARSALDAFGLNFYRNLADAADIGFRQNGMLWIATNPESWHVHIADMVPSLSASATVLDGCAAAAVAPVVNGRNIHKAVFQPEAAQIVAPQASRAVADLAAREGCVVHTRRPVTRLRVVGDRVIGVDTAWGPVDAGAVVLALGAWTNGLLADVGRFIPMMPFVVARIVTPDLGVPTTTPLLMLPEFEGMWVREWYGGLLYGTDFGSPPRYAFSRGPVPGRFDQLPLDGVLHMQRRGVDAAHVIPFLGTDFSMTPAHGAPCLTPDGVGLIGALDGVRDLWVASGCNALGISYGPGYGKVLAELIVHGTTDLLDASVLHPDRFANRYATLGEAVDDIKGLHAARRGYDVAAASNVP